MKHLYSMVLLVLVVMLPYMGVYGQITPKLRSYYVSKNGNDEKNNGRSVDKPFASLSKAIEMAGKGAVKTITIIDELNGSCDLRNTGKKEILLQGLVDSTDVSKVVFSSIIISEGGPFRIEDIKISGAIYRRGLIIRSADVTLGKGVKITNNTKGGVELDGGTLTMTDDASIYSNIAKGSTYFENYGGGVKLDGKLIMQDNSSIINNESGSIGGGIFVEHIDSGQIVLKGNAKVSGNIAGDDGGGIYVEEVDNYGTTPYITITENAIISNNSAGENGGGIFFAYSSYYYGRPKPFVEPFLLSDQAKITQNKAKNGGGLYLDWSSNTAFSLLGGKISSNTAEFGAGIYYKGEDFQGVHDNKKIAAPYGNTFKLNGGTITENVADFVGGGIYLEKNCKFVKKKGKIIKNSAGDGVGENTYTQE
ncbi:MAG: hypothetical protein PF638_16115 [Candidatus Delongbacteria bacterium]|jgi:predicted outer membrane repeat protein|nr:hypothetical protein [Candidatus Delongbacteria bacterium]